MHSIYFVNDASIPQSNIRAEEGHQRSAVWNSFCEGVLIPISSLFAVFLIMLGLILITP